MILIAGPCVIESYEILEETVETLLDTLKKYLKIEFYFKSSCVKDNRTKIENFKGVGFEKGIEWLLKIKEKYNAKICTDFHTITQIEEWGKYIDILQIPALLCQQTSLLESAAKTNKIIHIKKGQFLGIEQFKGPIDKLKNAGAEKIFATDRGTLLGYDRVFMDPRHVIQIKKYCKPTKVLVDITHPTKVCTKDSYGNFFDAYYIAMGYLAAGVDGIFMETHPSLKKALCDAITMIPLNIAERWIKDFYDLHQFINRRQNELYK